MQLRILKRLSIGFILLCQCVLAGDEYLLRVHGSKIAELAARYRLNVLKVHKGAASGLYTVQAPQGTSAAAMRSDPGVESLEQNGRMWLPEISLSSVASAGLGLGQPTAVNFYGAQALGAYVNQPAGFTIALQAARVFSTGKGIVAVIDTGVDPKHPVLAGSLVPGYDFTRNTPGGSEMADLDQSTTAILDAMQSTTAILDKTRAVVLNQSTTAILDQSTTAILDHAKLPAAFGHGTMVAGLVHLVAPTAKIMPVKAFAGDGSSTMANVVAGIYWAVDNGANVINMSFSTQDNSIELKKALDYATSRKVICVASVGNDGKNLVLYPAGYGAIGVGSTNNLMVRSSFSNYGNAADLAAPGERVITLYPANNYAAGWGTSFSAPFVAGGAALMLQLGPNSSQAAHALSQAIPIGQQLGAGELDLLWACLYRLTHGN